MNEKKPWYLSKTIWASIVSIAATLAAFFGFPVPEPVREVLTETILQLLSATAGLFAILGRLAAKSRIS